ncbi:MAG: hypothetical protein EBQ80_06460 [Proteobacteria bacterium]|nr:hypothetical protein [Pseudomonadota bacterium]
MQQNLTNLLTLLQNPSSPNFPTALQQLQALNLPALLPTLTPNQRTSLMAQLEATITTLQNQKSATAAQLQKLRTSTQALKSYQQH